MRQLKNAALTLGVVIGMFFGTQAIKRYQATDNTTQLKQLAGAGFQNALPTKTEQCVVTNNLPDNNCTPGAILADIVRGDVCKRGYASTAKAITATTRKQIFSAYNISEDRQKEFSIDHLISVNLGGSNDIANLWPQLKKESTEKNKVETFLLNEVCTGRITLSEAQELVSHHWATIPVQN